MIKGKIKLFYNDGLSASIPAETGEMPLNILANLICNNLKGQKIEMLTGNDTVYRSADDLLMVIVERGDDSYTVEFAGELKGLKVIAQ